MTVVCDPADYDAILDEIRAGGNTEKATRLKLSAKAYTHTTEYDSMIATYMRAQAGLNEKLFLEFDLVQSLRYGENPHQSAKFYREGKEVPYSLAFARQLNGKELSYNNIQDANAALCIVREFDKPFCVGLKHMNPCGAATGKDVVEAWTKAYEADKVSIFGGIVATNCTVTREAAELMKPIFLEIIMAPKFDEGALEVLSAKKNLRLLEVSMDKGDVDPKQYVSVNGGLLVQDLDVATKAVTADMCVTKAKPAAEQMEDLNFGWHIVKHVKSNAIVAVKDGRTLGVGAGQMNRIGSAEIALKQAHAAGVTEGLVLASDGFFPFDDCVTLAAEYGVTAIVQPGGSVLLAGIVPCVVSALFAGKGYQFDGGIVIVVSSLQIIGVQSHRRPVYIPVRTDVGEPRVERPMIVDESRSRFHRLLVCMEGTVGTVEFCIGFHGEITRLHVDAGTESSCTVR